MQSESSLSTTARPKRAPKQAQLGRTTRAILDATAALLAESGYRALTIEQISQRSGVARSSIYRRWRNTAELAIDAFDTALGPNPPVPDEGDIRSDLVLLYKRFIRILERPIWRSVLPSIIEASQTDSRFDGLLGALVGARRESERSIFRRAIERGEIRADAPVEWALDAMTGAYYHRLLMTGADLGEEGMTEWLVDSVLTRMRTPSAP